MSVYQFPRRRPPAVKHNKPKIGAVKEEPAEMGLIQGRKPGSILEWRVAVSLWAHHIEFIYQVPIRGGSTIRGGQIIDFVIYAPFKIPLLVHGEYWHKARSGEEVLNEAIIAQVFGRPPIVLWGEQLETQEMTDKIIDELIA